MWGVFESKIKNIRYLNTVFCEYIQSNFQFLSNNVECYFCKYFEKHVTHMIWQYTNWTTWDTLSFFHAYNSSLSLSLYLSLSSNTIVPTKGKKGNGLRTVKVITRHIRIWTLAQEWTHVRNPTCPVITFTRHKPYPKKKKAHVR